MEIARIKHQSIETLFRDTFENVIQTFGEANVFFSGMKMYIKMGGIVVSVQFTSTSQLDKVFDQLTLTALNKYGPLDMNSTPFTILMKETKAPSGNTKTVNVKMIMNETGEYTVVWTEPISELDQMALNNFIINYVELFSKL